MTTYEDIPSSGGSSTITVGDPVIGGSDGAILFIHPANTLAQDAINLSFDDVNIIFNVGANSQGGTNLYSASFGNTNTLSDATFGLVGGYASQVGGFSCLAWGTSCIITSDCQDSAAFGNGALIATSFGSLGVGFAPHILNSSYSLVIGSNCISQNGANCFVGGNSCTADGADLNFIFGDGSSSLNGSPGSIIFGNGITLGGSVSTTRTIYIGQGGTANGCSDTTIMGLSHLVTDGQYQGIYGHNCTITGGIVGSHCFGPFATITSTGGGYNMCFGNSYITGSPSYCSSFNQGNISGNASFSVCMAGDLNSTDNGGYNFCFSSGGTISSGSHNKCFGQQNYMYGDAGFIATGDTHITTGFGNTALGSNSHIVNGYGASALSGYSNQPYGYASTTMGESNSAAGRGSFAGGIQSWTGYPIQSFTFNDGPGGVIIEISGDVTAQFTNGGTIKIQPLSPSTTKAYDANITSVPTYGGTTTFTIGSSIDGTTTGGSVVQTSTGAYDVASGAFAFGDQANAIGIRSRAWGRKPIAAYDGSVCETDFQELFCTTTETNQHKQRFQNGWSRVQGIPSSDYADGPIQTVKQGRVLTTDGSQTKIIDITMPEGSVALFTAEVTGYRVGGAAGSTGDCVAFIRQYTGKYPTGGSPAVIAVSSIYTNNTDIVGSDVTITVDTGPSVYVTGATDYNMTWYVNVTYQINKGD